MGLLPRNRPLCAALPRHAFHECSSGAWAPGRPTQLSSRDARSLCWATSSPLFSEWAKQVHNYHFLGIVFAALMLFQFSMSRIAPRPHPWVQQSSGDVDLTPWRWARPIALGISLCVFGIYVVFANSSGVTDV